MKGVTESLAGRVAIIELQGFAIAEIQQRANTLLPFLPTNRWITQTKQKNQKHS